MQRAKTGPLDAGVILEYLKRMEFKQWEPPREICLKIQAITRRICQLKEETNWTPSEQTTPLFNIEDPH